MKLTTKQLNINIICMYAITFFHNLIFAYVIERLFSLSRGITLEMLALLEITYNSSVILLEVPSGYLADIWSRKKLLMISAFLTCLEFLILFFAHNMAMFFIATMAAGIGKTFSSGADNALLFDSLKALGKQDTFKQHMSRIRFFDYSAGIIAALSGAYIASVTNLSMNYLLSFFSCIFVLICTFFLTEVNPQRVGTIGRLLTNSSQEIKSTLNDFKQIFNFFTKNKILLFVIFFGVISEGVTTQLDEYYQILIKDIGIPIYLFGFVSLFSLGACSIGSLLSVKLENKFNKICSFAIFLLFMATCLILILFSTNLLIVVPLFMFYLFYAITEPLVITKIHDSVIGNLRATTESFYSLVERLSCMLIVMPFAMLSQRVNIKYGIVLLIVILIASATFIFIGSIRTQNLLIIEKERF